MSKSKDWIGVDLDRTLAIRYSGDPITQIGDRIEPMCARVKAWLANGQTVKIFTARVNPMHEDLEVQREMIRVWTNAKSRSRTRGYVHERPAHDRAVGRPGHAS